VIRRHSTTSGVSCATRATTLSWPGAGRVRMTALSAKPSARRMLGTLDRDGRRLLLGWGAVLAMMNVCFYSAV